MERFLNNNEMGREIGRLLTDRGLSMATAESCTGGTIASMVTAIAGSSSYFKGGIVSYAVSVKEQVLGVTLHDGVVSEDTARQMAKGAVRVCGADCAVATTGVAGPGPSEGNPQGTVCIAACINPNANPNLDLNANPNLDLNANHNASANYKVLSRTFCFEGEREAVILQAADSALRLLRTLITQENEKSK